MQKILQKQIRGLTNGVNHTFWFAKCKIMPDLFVQFQCCAYWFKVFKLSFVPKKNIMAKTAKGKVIQMLTPENYIRQKARTLPLYECLLNTEWEENGLANIIVARKHTTGNITAGMYLVDIHCLGVKDASYWFNITEFQYREILSHAKGTMELEKVSYELVHNIVFAALEFAGDYGFKPHKDFTSVAQYILEEDTDDIELIEIECGMDGKPAFVSGPFDDAAKVAKIVAQLEKTAGPGNYIFINEIEQSDFNTQDDEEFTPSNTTFQFKIEIDGVSNPKVWRRLTLPSNATFLHFHYVIQFAFGWKDDHLFSFSEEPYGSPEITEINDNEMDDREKLDAGEVMLSEFFKKEKQQFTYVYDFGDSWEHIITLEKMLPETCLLPNCLDGEGKCPPEDCGGAGAYQELKKILTDKKHPEYKDYADWLGLRKGKMWNAAEFDIEKTRKALKDIY